MSKETKLAIVVIFIIYICLCHSLLGSQFDKEFLEGLDTQAIEAYCRENKNCHENENGSVSVYFEGEVDNSDIIVMIDIYDENVFPSKAKVRRNVTSRFNEHCTTSRIKINNLDFFIIETTDKPRSKDAQLFLQSIFE